MSTASPEVDIDLNLLFAQELICQGWFYCEPAAPCPESNPAVWRAWAHCCHCQYTGDTTALLCDKCLVVWILLMQDYLDDPANDWRCEQCHRPLMRNADHIVKRVRL